MTFASLCFFAATLIASARLTFTVSKDFISFSVETTSGSGARCAKADVAAHKIRSERIFALLTESLPLQVPQLALKAGPNVGAPPATQASMLPGKIRHLTRRPIQPDGFQS